MRTFAFLTLIGIFVAFLYRSNSDNKKSIAKIERELKAELKKEDFQKSLVLVTEQIKKNESKSNKSDSTLPKHNWEKGNKFGSGISSRVKSKMYSFMDLVKGTEAPKSTEALLKRDQVKEIVTIVKNDPEGKKAWEAIIMNDDFLGCNKCLVSLFKITNHLKERNQILYRRAEDIIENKVLNNSFAMKDKVGPEKDFYIYKEAVDFYLEQNRESIMNGDDSAIYKIKASDPHPDILEFMENKINNF
ncbi:MAG: hypothetical protein HOP07_13620 [Bacteriovoracaceae bacterium]|nr:hypothetical protein [Bacteriovoracaceae bacterium]